MIIRTIKNWIIEVYNVILLVWSSFKRWDSTSRLIAILIATPLLLVGLYHFNAFNLKNPDAAPNPAESSQQVDMFFIGDSWTAFPGQTGQSVNGCTMPVFGAVFNGVPDGFCPYVPILGGHWLGGAGFEPTDEKRGLSDEGLVRDRLNARGITYSQITKHEYAIGGTTATAWAAGVPADNEPITNATGHFAQANLLQNLANPPSGKAIVWMTMGGNDVFPYGIHYKLNDAGDDPLWEAQMDVIQNNIQTMVDFMIRVNPDVEIVMPSYTNMKVNDGEIYTFPQIGTTGFCREFWGANANGSGFFATTWNDYNVVRQEWAINHYDTVEGPAYRSAFISTWLWQVPWLISYAQLEAQADTYVASLRTDRINYLLSEAAVLAGEGPNHQPQTLAQAYRNITEIPLNSVMQKLNRVWTNVADSHPDNVKFFPVWETISIEDVDYPQPIEVGASAPRALFGDCVHLNPEGYSKYIDRILNLWLPQSKYLNSR